eukprot:m.124858 g.124858  ORF g.124858 m.124858 type:complete len:350 (+) comp37861_c0_seq3:36-1085(+)
MLAKPLFHLTLFVAFTWAEDQKETNFQRCYSVKRVVKFDKEHSRCFIYEKDAHLPEYDSSVNDGLYTIDSSKVFNGAYPDKIKCVWQFQMDAGEVGIIKCKKLDLVHQEGDCDIGYCNDGVAEVKTRDHLTIQGLSQNDKCKKRKTCGECKVKGKGMCKDTKKKSKPSVTFCGKLADGKPTLGGRIWYDDTNKGKVRVIFWADETRRGDGFYCRYINFNKTVKTVKTELSKMGDSTRARSSSGRSSSCCIPTVDELEKYIEEWASSDQDFRGPCQCSSSTTAKPDPSVLPTQTSKIETTDDSNKPVPTPVDSCRDFNYSKCEQRGKGCGKRCKVCCSKKIKQPRKTSLV